MDIKELTVDPWNSSLDGKVAFETTSTHWRNF